MYTSLKTISAISIVIGVINAVAAVLTIMMIAPLECMTFTILVAIGAFMACTSITLLVIGGTLWSLHDDLDASLDSNYEALTDLRKRVEKLESEK